MDECWYFRWVRRFSIVSIGFCSGSNWDYDYEYDYVHEGPSKKSAEILAAKMNKETAFENAPQSTISVRADIFVAPIPVVLVSRWVFGGSHEHEHEQEYVHVY